MLSGIIGNPLLVSAGTIQNALECKRKIGKAPRNLNAQIDWIERRLACWKDQQNNERDDKIPNIPTTTQLRERSSNQDFELGLQYYQGRGVPKSYSKAKKFLEIGANAGHAGSQSLLGTLYYHGRGVLKDYDIAFGWFRLAALQGDEKARKKIAYMYNYGVGVSQNIEKANYWYKLAGPTDLTDSLATSTRPMRPGRSAPQPGSTSTTKVPRKKELPLERVRSRKNKYARKNRDFTLGYSLAYRYDQFDWNIAGQMNGCCPNVQSELDWEDLHIAQLAIDATGRINRFYYRARFGYGAILDGSVSDTDYGGNGRTNITSKLQASSDRGYVLDSKFGLGFSLYELQGFKVVPMVGYSYSKQRLAIHHHATYHAGGGAIAGLNSTYSAFWRGPWIGLDLLMQRSNNWDIALGFEYHLADYYAEANWNLRNDFQHPKSFEHFNNGMSGKGILGHLNLRYQFSQKWAGEFMTEFQKFGVDTGTDRTFFANGNVTDVLLNEVNWKSFTMRFGVHYVF